MARAVFILAALLLSGCVVVMWSDNVAVEQEGVETHAATGEKGKTKPTTTTKERR